MIAQQAKSILFKQTKAARTDTAQNERTLIRALYQRLDALQDAGRLGETEFEQVFNEARAINPDPRLLAGFLTRAPVAWIEAQQRNARPTLQST